MAYKDFHPTIHAMGDEECFVALIERSITEFEDLSLKETRGSALASCTQLSRVSLPLMKVSGASLCANSSALTEINAPLIESMVYRYCYGCTSLKLVEINIKTGIGHNSFTNTALETLILRDIRLVSNLDNINAFANTPIANGTGYIYVPKKMLDGRDGIAAYEAATNWSSFAGQFRYIEDYPEITGGLYP